MDRDKIFNEHDLGYKSVLSNKKNFIDFLKGFVKKDWVKLINEENLILVDKEFILEDFKEEEADIIYRVDLEGNEIIFYVLLELQSTVDFRMPIRLLLYMTEIYRDELKNTDEKLKKRKDYRLPAIIPLVLYNGKNNWSAARSFKEIVNGYEMFEDSIIDFKYMLFDINRMKESELIEIANVVSSIFLLDQDVEISEIVKRLKIIGKLIRNNVTKEQQKSLRDWLINILNNRLEEGDKGNILRSIFQASESEGDTMVSNLGRKIEEAFNFSKAEGVEIGLKKGKYEMARNLIIMGIELDMIVKASGLNKSEIEKLREEIH